MSLLKLAHQYIQKVLKAGDIVIDATVGNGHDTLFLAEQVGVTGRVYGFDIQAAAINATRQKLQRAQLVDCVRLIQASHADMFVHIPTRAHGKIRACMFNLGYLPKGNKSIITQTESTLPALTVASELLASQGIMTVLAYPGHAGGDKETTSVETWLAQLSDNKFVVNTFFSTINSQTAPRLFVLEKLM